MAGGYDREHRRPFAPEGSPSGYEQSWRERMDVPSSRSAAGDPAAAHRAGADAEGASAHPRAGAARARLAFTRPRRPGFCWVAVTLYGKDVERPGFVARWVSTPDGWQALVAWCGLEDEVRVEWVAAGRLTAVHVERAP